MSITIYIRFVWFLVIFFTAQLFIPASQKESNIPEHATVVTNLERIGAIWAKGNEYILEKGIVCYLEWDGDHLATIGIGLNYENPEKGLFTEWRMAADDRNCCMSLETFNRLLGKLNQVKELGDFVRKSDLDIIPTAGWIRRGEEYKNAYLVISQMNSADQDGTTRCGIDKFYIHYLFSESGTVEKKFCKTIGPQKFRILEYYMIINARRFNVSKTAYNHTKVNDVVTVKWSSDQQFVRVNGE